MKTFKQFQEGLSLSQVFARLGKPGIPSERPTGRTTLFSLRTPNVPITPLNQVTFRDREEAGRNPPYQTGRRPADNPNYQLGTRDMIPGSTPSSNPYLPPLSSLSSKPKPKTVGPIKPRGTGNWV